MYCFAWNTHEHELCVTRKAMTWMHASSRERLRVPMSPYRILREICVEHPKRTRARMKKMFWQYRLSKNYITLNCFWFHTITKASHVASALVMTSAALLRLINCRAIVFIMIFIFEPGKTPGGSKITKIQIVWKCTLLWSIKPSCIRTELNRCTTTEIRCNKNEDARTSSVVFTNRLTNWLKNWRASLLIGRETLPQSGQTHPVMRVQHTWLPY